MPTVLKSMTTTSLVALKIIAGNGFCKVAFEVERANNELLARGQCRTIISNSVSDLTLTRNFFLWYNREGVDNEADATAI